MKKNYILVILILILFAGAFWYLTKATDSSQKGQNSAQTAVVRPSQNEETKASLSGKILFTDKQKEFVLKKYDLTQEKTETIFTDKDESYKVKSVAGRLTNDRMALFVEGEKKQIIAVSLDGSAKTEVLFDDIGNPDSVAVSPDGEILAFVFFSNVEREYGYNLYIKTNDGQEESLARSDNQFTNLLWNSNATKLLYLDKKEPNKIISYDFALRKNIAFYNFDNEVYSFNFDKSDLYVSLLKNIDSLVIKLDSEGANLTEQAKITKTKAFNIFELDGNIAFLSSTGAEPVSAGKIKIDTKDGIISIEEASNILDWLKN